jgi:hypothetical protein
MVGPSVGQTPFRLKKSAYRILIHPTSKAVHTILIVDHEDAATYTVSYSIMSSLLVVVDRPLPLPSKGAPVAVSELGDSLQLG